VISRAAVAGKARTGKSFDGLLKDTPLTMVCVADRLHFFMNQKPPKQRYLSFADSSSQRIIE
jgi:hypothetical protein